jgi:hypothetical protein
MQMNIPCETVSSAGVGHVPAVAPIRARDGAPRDTARSVERTDDLRRGVFLTAHAVLRWAERALGVDVAALLEGLSPGAGDGATLAALERLRSADVRTWRESLRTKVASTAAWGIPDFVIVDHAHGVRVIVRGFVVVTVLPRRRPPGRLRGGQR